jgi:acyl-CoA reductase-like NAD-dependent aldehyde dehydrogenase
MHEYVEAILKARFTQTIGGEPVATAFEDVIDPSKGLPFQRSPVASDAEVDMAVKAARRAQPGWAARSWDERAQIINALGNLIEENIDYLMTLQTMEQGMPLATARICIGLGVASMRQFAEIRVEDRVLVDDGTRRVVENWRPLGVVAAISPWNFPIALGFQKVGNALIGGNTVVLKPSELTPLTTLEIGRLACGVLPPGVLNVIGGGRASGAALVAHPDVDKVSFTGSTATGVAIAQESGKHLRPVTLELGGNDAAILLEDGSIDDLVAAIIEKALANRGQYCAAVKRVYVPASLHDRFCAALVAASEAIRIGNGLDPETDMGPIQNKVQFDRICDYVEDAERAGGRVLTGGRAIPGNGYYYPPTVITGLADDARLVEEEQFGPIMPIIVYDDLDAVIERINAGPYGLTGSFWTADIPRGLALASRLVVGTGWINQHGNFDLGLPFPLIKASGMGFDFADLGVKGAMRMQVVHAVKPSHAPA